MKTILSTFAILLTLSAPVAATAGDLSFRFACTKVENANLDEDSILRTAIEQLEKIVAGSTQANARAYKLTNVSAPTIDRTKGTVICATLTYEKKLIQTVTGP